MSVFNSSLWELSYLQNFASQQVQTTQFPIPVFDTGLLTKETIKVKVTSNAGNRRFVSTLNHCITLDNGEVNIIERYSLYSSDSRILVLKPLSPYFLRFIPYKSIEQMTVSVYQFTG